MKKPAMPIHTFSTLKEVKKYIIKIEFNAITPTQLQMNEKIDDVCDDKEFCILTASKNSFSVDELKAMVRKHGGRIGNNNLYIFTCFSKNFMISAYCNP